MTRRRQINAVTSAIYFFNVNFLDNDSVKCNLNPIVRGLRQIRDFRKNKKEFVSSTIILHIFRYQIPCDASLECQTIIHAINKLKLLGIELN